MAENRYMAQGGAYGQDVNEIRPRSDTAHWAAALALGWLVLCIGLHDGSLIFTAGMFGALWLQCRQRLVIEGQYVRRIGLRPCILDLSTAEVVSAGRRWWVELFFLGRSLQLRDAEGHRLYLESWLWDDVTRAVLAQAAGGGVDS
jgi:hypothetical protein